MESKDSPFAQQVQYRFIDQKTGLLIETLEVELQHPRALLQSKDQNDPFYLPIAYTIEIPVASALMEQIRSLWREDFSNYREVIASSIRSIFEVCLFQVRLHKKFLFKDPKPRFDEDLLAMLDSIKNTQSIIETIDKNTQLGFKSLNNWLDLKDFEAVLKKAHLGAHKSTIFIGNHEIEDLARKAAIFAVLSNEILYKIPDDKWGTN